MPELDDPSDYLPAILIGTADPQGIDADELLWAHTVDHQHGGYACLQSRLHGVLLPLRAVPACSPLMAGFEALSLDSRSKRAFAQFPELASVHLTAGQQYEPSEIQILQRFVAGAEFAFPVITCGTEALLELRDASPAAFLGWPLLMLEMPAACALDDPDARHLAIGPLGIWEGRVLSRPTLDRLREVVGGDLEVYLLWNNSD